MKTFLATTAISLLIGSAAMAQSTTGCVAGSTDPVCVGSGSTDSSDGTLLQNGVDQHGNENASDASSGRHDYSNDGGNGGDHSGNGGDHSGNDGDHSGNGGGDSGNDGGNNGD